MTTNFQHLVELKLAEQYLNDYWECTSSDGVTYYTLYARGEEINGENPGLSGKILENVGAMSSLNDISIGGNTFSGSISPDIGRLEHLGTRILPTSNHISLCSIVRYLLMYRAIAKLCGKSPFQLDTMTLLVHCLAT